MKVCVLLKLSSGKISDVIGLISESTLSYKHTLFAKDERTMRIIVQKYHGSKLLGDCHYVVVVSV